MCFLKRIKTVYASSGKLALCDTFVDELISIFFNFKLHFHETNDL